MFPLCFTRKHSLIHHPPPCKWTTPPSVSHNNNNDTSSLYVCVCVCFALIPYRKRTGIYSANPWLCFHQLSQSHSHQTHSRWNWLLANETDHRPIEGEEEEGTYVSEQIHFHDRHLFSNSPGRVVSILIIISLHHPQAELSIIFAQTRNQCAPARKHQFDSTEMIL